MKFPTTVLSLEMGIQTAFEKDEDNRYAIICTMQFAQMTGNDRSSNDGESNDHLSSTNRFFRTGEIQDNDG